MGLRDKLRRLEREAHGEMIEILQRDGTVRRFPMGKDGALWGEVLVYEYDRGKRYLDGENSGPAHPVIEALRGADDGELQCLTSEHGTIVGMLVGEDAIIRGEQERPGPPVRETSLGVYE